MIQKIKAFIAFVCLLALAAQGIAANEGPDLRLKGKPSGRDLLSLKSRIFSLQSSGPDTVRILAIRVEFETDTLDVTTGDGKFVLTVPDEPVIDPPPHDKNYFEAQLLALANYYRTVSNGTLVLTYQVFPQENQAAYQLPNDMRYYSPDDETLADQRLAELFRDAFVAADQQDTLPFGTFDSFIVFHAGVGKDISFDFDPTPNDIPSAFLNLNDLADGLANGDPAYQGVAVNNSNFLIQDGIVLPETESQEGYEIGLLGTSAIMMGFQLGLPSLFSAETGASGIGRWGLMDQGSGNFLGLLPAEPSAWEKVFMGWEQPITVSNGENFQVAAPRVTITPNKIYKIPINADEYFLVENRQRDVNSDNIAVGTDVLGNRVEFTDAEGGSVSANAAIGVIVSVDEYDYGLPGSGILIWHIDEKIVRAKLSENRINADREHKGVDLEEADGAQDIGQLYGFLDAGSGAENGVWEDAWWASNPVITEFLRPGQDVTFGPDTQPSTRANNRANSHIVMYGFSESADIMSFSVRNELVVEGFPQYVGPGGLPPVAADLNPDVPGLEVLVTREDGALLAWQANGGSLLPTVSTVSVEAPGMETRQFPLATWRKFDAGIAFPPAVVDADNDGAEDVVVALADQRLVTISGKILDNDGNPAILWQADLAAQPSSQVAVRNSDQTLWLGLANGELHGFSSATGASAGSFSVSSAITDLAVTDGRIALAAGSDFYVKSLNAAPQFLLSFPTLIENVAIADLENDGELDFIAASADGSLVIYSENGASPELSKKIGTVAQKTGMAVGDVDGDGRKDLVFVSKTGISAYNFNGASLLNFPIAFSTSDDSLAPPFVEPLLLQTADRAGQTVLAFSSAGDLIAYSHEGILLDELSTSLANQQQVASAAADLDRDGEMELLSISGDQMLTALRLNGVPATGKHAWTGWAGNAQRTRSNTQTEVPQLSEGNLLPANMAYNYPNPTEGSETTIRYRLNGAVSKVSIKIFDLAGDLVDEFAGPATANADNEIRWQLWNIQSGVYFARIEAQAESKSEVALFKIAVVR